MAPFLCEALSIWKSAFSFFLFVGVHILHTTWELAWNKHAMLTCRPQDNWNISAMLHLGICSIEHDNIHIIGIYFFMQNPTTTMILNFDNFLT